MIDFENRPDRLSRQKLAVGFSQDLLRSAAQVACACGVNQLVASIRVLEIDGFTRTFNDGVQQLIAVVQLRIDAFLAGLRDQQPRAGNRKRAYHQAEPEHRRRGERAETESQHGQRHDDWSHLKPYVRTATLGGSADYPFISPPPA